MLGNRQLALRYYFPGSRAAASAETSTSIPNASSSTATDTTKTAFGAPIDTLPGSSGMLNSITNAATSSAASTSKSVSIPAPMHAAATSSRTSTVVPNDPRSTIDYTEFGIPANCEPTAVQMLGNHQLALRYYFPGSRAAASAETSTVIPKDQENPPASGSFSKPTAAPGNGKGKGKEVRAAIPFPPTKEQMRELAKRQKDAADASVEAINKKLLEEYPISREESQRIKAQIRRAISIPVPGNRVVTVGNNRKFNRIIFSAFPAGHSAVVMTATVRILKLEAFNLIPPQYQQETRKYTERPHVWIRCHQNMKPFSLMVEHPLDQVDQGPFFKYEDLCKHVSFEKNSEGVYASLEAGTARKRRSGDVKDVALSVLDLVISTAGTNWEQPPGRHVWKQITVNTGLGTGIPKPEFKKLYDDVEVSKRRRAEVGFRPLPNNDCEFSDRAPESDEFFANGQRYFIAWPVTGNPNAIWEANVPELEEFFEEAARLQREVDQKYPPAPPPAPTHKSQKRPLPQASSGYSDPSHPAKKRRLAPSEADLGDSDDKENGRCLQKQ
ncbi:hypothetical protein BJ741DRAFT_637636 [Chytriomyces cf. hyalinus JEL632]|nr:hypothetical protein BJ741DRAFT_637636 [Chytriomyces cf. hyalinus JEL632]